MVVVLFLKGAYPSWHEQWSTPSLISFWIWKLRHGFHETVLVLFWNFLMEPTRVDTNKERFFS
jgi:hypothetical protein